MSTTRKCICVLSYETDFYKKLVSVVDNKYASVFNYFNIHDMTSTSLADFKCLIVNATVNPLGVIKYVENLVSDDFQEANKYLSVLFVVPDAFKDHLANISTTLTNVQFISESRIHVSNRDFLNSLLSVMVILDKSYDNHSKSKNSYNYEYGNAPMMKFNIKLDPKTYRVFINNMPISFCKINFKILEILISRKNEVVTREELIQAVWGNDKGISLRTTDVHLKRIRDKLMPNLDYRLSPVRTARNLGYYYVCYEDLVNKDNASAAEKIAQIEDSVRE